MTYIDQAALAEDVDFRSRVRLAVMTAAVDVMGEAQTGSDSEYGKRAALARAVLDGGASAHLDRFAWGVAANVAITGASVDGDIQFTVNSLWGDMAGVTAVD